MLDVSAFGDTLPDPGIYPLFSVNGTIGSLPTWTYNFPTPWWFGTVTQVGNEVVLNLTGVPEPSTALLLGIGVVSLLAYAWRRRRQAA